MSQKCTGCERTSSHVRLIDIPDSARLCEECYEDYVWECESCGKKIALPEIEGGENSSSPPLLGELCENCLSETISQCELCGDDELIEDLIETDDGLLCKRCVASPERSHEVEEDEPVLLAFDNWEKGISDAINRLPSDLRDSVGYKKVDQDTIVIVVAAEPIPSDSELDEAELCTIEIKKWNSTRDRGWPSQFDSMYGPGGHAEEQADWPVITIDGPKRGYESGFYLGRSRLRDFQRDIQQAILEELWSGGGVSMVAKDWKGRYIRDDGSIILEWQ